MNKELLEKFFLAKEEYKRVESELLALLTKEDVGKHKISKKLTIFIGICTTYKYSDRFKEKMKLLYNIERKKENLLPKETLYIRKL